MPYRGEKAGKTGHASFIKNPDISAFLAACDYMRVPSSDAAVELAKNFLPAPQRADLPDLIVACDGSSYCAALNDNILPSTQVGYVKISLAMIKVGEYQDLANSASAYVDPFQAAKLQEEVDAVSIVLPGANIIYEGAPDVASSFRKALFLQCQDDRTNWIKGEPFSIVDFLFDLCGESICLKSCPNCGRNPEDYFRFARDKRILHCGECNAEIYLTDILRIHEQLSDFGDNTAAITRVMNVVEHLLIASLINMLYKKDQSLLSRIAFILDGPLAIFGQPAKIHARLMGFYEKIRQGMQARGMRSPIIFGAQKNGALADHANMIKKHIKADTYMSVSDKYRARHIQNNKENLENFGHETYYGQDFFFKTQKGNIFAFALPYPYSQKGDRAEFALKKSKPEAYGDAIARTLEIIRRFECDLYSNSLVPITLAHRHASISFVPGGNVLKLLARVEMGKQK